MSTLVDRSVVLRLLLVPSDPYRRLDSYLKVGSSIYKQCTEEAKNGLLIRVINEVDVFVDDKKMLRASEVRRSKEGTEFTFMEKITRR